VSTSSSVPGELVPGEGVPGDPGASAPPAGWPHYYTVNFCPNPSAETDLTGYSPVTGTETITQDLVSFSGKYGVKVTIPGQAPGEGIATPFGPVIAYAQGSMSLYVYGTAGRLTVSAVQSPGGQVLGSIQVQPGSSSDWQRVELDQLAMTSGKDVFLEVTTTTTQALTFWIDAVQYEPTSPAHPYTDSDQQYTSTETSSAAPSSARMGEVMRDTAPAQIAYQAFQYPVSADGGMVLEGAIEVVVTGEVVVLSTIAGQMDMSGQLFNMAAVSGPRTVIAPAIDTGIPGMPWLISGGGGISAVTIVSPGPGFAEFAIFGSTDPDPAMTMIGPNNAGTVNGKGNWTQVYGTFSPPAQRLDTNGNAVWQAAAYMAAGFKIGGQAKHTTSAPNAVNFAQVQVEKAHMSTPSPFQRPRSLSTIVKPSQMNYVTNPSIEQGTNGWAGIVNATVVQVSGGYQGSYSLQVTVTEAGDGAMTEVPLLIFGDTFSASAYVSPVSGNIADIRINAENSSALALPSGNSFGAGGFGAGPFGGVNTAGAPMATGTWYRAWTSFTAPASTATLKFTPVAVQGATYPLVFNIDCVAVNPGEVLEPYADGNSDGWQWELGGTPGLSRSYYYERESAGANAVQGVLDKHIPLGLTAYAPQFAVPATQ
jgi:hypothetical protein